MYARTPVARALPPERMRQAAMRPRDPAVLMIHGAGGGGWEWALWRGVFEAQGLAVVTPDLQPAAAGLAATTFADYREQVRRAAAALPRPRVLVGASLGGLLCACCAGTADALVLVNPLPPAPACGLLPRRAWLDVVRWGDDARLASTRRALPDADAATALHAWRRWRNESGRVLREAYDGIEVPRPACPVLCVGSRDDDDVPPAVVRALAADWQAELLASPASSHVGPLLGRAAAATALQVRDWIGRALRWGGPDSRAAACRDGDREGRAHVG